MGEASALKSYWGSWESSGKSAFVKHCKNAVAHATSDTAAIAALQAAFYGLASQVVGGTIKPESAASTAREMLLLRKDVASLLADTLCVVDVETTADDDIPARERFLSFLSTLLPNLPDWLVKERLDLETLENVGLVKNSQQFQQKYVKIKTKLYYKQQKFNLLREENEGYAKLLTELLTAAPKVDANKVKTIESLIGYFNLDPNRVLDVILEAFECLPHNVDMFVSLLRDHTHNKNTLCQVLGFKFKFYQKNAASSAAGGVVADDAADDLKSDAAATTPASLFRVAALLLQHELVDLDSLYPHLTPDDTVIVETYKKEIADAKQYARKLNCVILNKGAGEGIGASSSSATGDEKKKDGLLGPGGDDSGRGSSGLGGSSSSGIDSSKNDSSSDLLPIQNAASRDPGLVGAPLADVEFNSNAAANQKLGLIKALLEVGAWDAAKVMLNRMPPKHATSYPPLADAFCHLIHAAIEPLYQKHSGMSAVLKSPPKVMLPSGMPCPEELRIHNWQDYGRRLLPMTHYLGLHMSRDPILMVKLTRLSRCYVSEVMTPMTDGASDPIVNGVNGIAHEDHNGRPKDIDPGLAAILSNIDEVMLPSLALLPCNCCVSDELWQLLKSLPYTFRYRLYGQWKNDSYNSHARLIRAKADCLERGKYIMKRLTKESVKPSGRHLGKLSHSNPGIIFEYVLSQIQKYDNFILPVVDSLKYLTQLSYDVLAFCIIEALANPDRERQKAEETNISPWLASLASFCGNIFRKYQVDLAGLLQYVSNQLKAGKSFDLLVLREVVQKMSGIEITEELTNDQLEAMAGGEMLRQEGGYFAQVRNTKKPSSRLKEALLEHKLALPMVMLMAQHRDCAVYQEAAERHVKLTGKLFDTCQDTLVQFGSFLATQLSADEWLKRLPSIDVLVSQYNLQPDAGFFLSRPMYQTNIIAKYGEAIKKLEKDVKDKEKREAKEAKEAAAAAAAAEKSEEDSGQTSTSAKSSPSPKVDLNKARTERHIQVVNAVIEPIVEQVKPLFSDKIWNDLSTKFYVTFWTLSMYDLKTPADSYEKERQKLAVQNRMTEDNAELPANKKKKEIERCKALMEKLTEEEKKQQEHVERTYAFLRGQKESWFGVSKSTKNDTVTQFLQLCIFPRVVFSPNDAVFCALFIRAVHDLKTTNFSTLICFDRLFCDVTLPLAQCTENEASRYGRFMAFMLETVSKWHSDKKVYDEECANYPGFKTVFRSGGTGKAGANDSASSNKEDHLDFENYRHVCHKWHFKITKSIINCLESGDYLLIRNSLIILTKIAPFFPRIQNLGQALERRVEKLQKDEKESRADLYVLALGYGGMLKMNKKNWILEGQFHTASEKKSSAAAASASSSTTSANSSSGAALGVIGASRREAASKTSEKSAISSSVVPPSAASTLKSDAGAVEKKVISTSESSVKKATAPIAAAAAAAAASTTSAPLPLKKENGASTAAAIKEERKEKSSREVKEAKSSSAASAAVSRDVKVLPRIKDPPMPKDNGLKVEDHVEDHSTSSSPRNVSSKSGRTSQSPLDHRRGGRGVSEDRRFESAAAAAADAPSGISKDGSRGDDRHRSSRSVEHIEAGRPPHHHREHRESSIVSNSGEEEEASPHHRSGSNGASRRQVEEDDELLHSSSGSHGSKEHKKRKVEAKSHESPKSHKKDKSSSGSGCDGGRVSSKAAKRARRSPSLDYDGDSSAGKRSRKDLSATNGSGGGGGSANEISSSSSHKERKLEKESKNRDRDRIAISGLSSSAGGSRESSPATAMLSKDQRLKDEKREDRKTNDRLQAIAAGNVVFDDKRKVESLLGDGGGSHKKSSKHDKHRSK